jgi:hypothetical protein
MADFTLNIETWAGLSVGATHYYGELKNDKRELVGDIFMHWMSKKLTVRDAQKINKKFKWEYSDEYYKMVKVKPGEIDYRFETEEDVIKAAKKQFLKIANVGDRLIDNNHKEIIYAIK